jgi:hypothetical protein
VRYRRLGDSDLELSEICLVVENARASGVELDAAALQEIEDALAS